jgi:hypothetical protein
VGAKQRLPFGYIVEQAEQLFAQSVASGKPDYKYVALAIGASPAAPPDWAVGACIELRRAEEQKSSRGICNDVSDILDEMVRHFDRTERAFYESGERKGGYSPPSLRSTIRQATTALGQRKGDVNRADDDWCRDIIRAWNEEQKHDRAPHSAWELEGFVTTARIDRVLTQAVAKELGDPEDTATWAWMTKRVIEQHHK